MRIDSPKMTNAEVTGSFKGSFSGSFEGDIQADSVAFANVTGKPTLVSGSSQIVFTAIAPNGIISGSASDARSQLGVVIGTDVQAYADNLNDIAGLNASDSNFIVGNGSAFVAESGATARASLGLGDFATISSLAYADLTNIPSGIVSSSAQIDELFNVDGLVSGSSLSSTGQGSVTLTTNGVAASAVDLGLETSDSPTFAGLTVNGAITVTGNVDGRDVSADGTKLDGIESGADVTDTTNVTAAGALMDSEVTSLSGIKTLTVPDNTTISSFGASLVDDADASAARTTLGVDAAGTDNSTDVTLVTTSHDYLSLSGQAITLGTIDISDDTNLAVSDTTGQTGINLTLSGDTISGVVSGLTTTSNVQFANLTVSGDLTVSGTTTSINSTNLDVTDKLIAVNRGGTTGASADGGGLFISGANEAMTWDNGNSRFNFSDDVHAAGNITLTGTVDGRDVAADGLKLDGIEAGADVTDATNVQAAGALMDSELASITDVKALNQSVVSGASPTFSTANMTDATNKRFMTDAQESKLDGIATGADNYSSWTIKDGDTTTYTITSGDTLTIAAGAGITSNFTADDVLTITNTITNNSQLTNGAGYITSAGSISGNAATATALQTARTIAGVSFDGTANISLNNANITNGAGYTTYSANQTLNNNSNVHFEGLMVGQTTGATANTIRCVGDIVAYYSSDAQFKDNVTQLDGALDKVKQIRGVSFDWNDKQDVYEGHDIGVIAQEVEAVYPELVHYREHNDSKAVDYVKLTAVLIEAVKELSAKVEALENK